MSVSATDTLASAHRRITTLAAATSVHRAFHWLHLHQPQLRQWLLQLVAIPAPTFAERPRAEAVVAIFRALELQEAHCDRAGNALAEIGGVSASGTQRGQEPVLLISAHLDTVFPAGTSCGPREEGSRIYAPGVCDNAAGLTGLLGLAAALRFAAIAPPVTIVFCASTGEEGEGNLSGMRHLFAEGRYASRIACALILDGAGDSAVVTQALGSLRFRISVSGPGGHSWADAGAPNPIFLLARILSALEALPLPSAPRTTLNAGLITGGTSINSVPAEAVAQLDLRSTDPGTLHDAGLRLQAAAGEIIASANREYLPGASASLAIDLIGHRPAAELPAGSALLSTLRAVDRHLSLRTDLRIGSTDANLPLSLGIPAVALGAGGSGGGIHTLGEWYDPSGRETALRRILLTLLDTAQLLAASTNEPRILFPPADP